MYGWDMMSSYGWGSGALMPGIIVPLAIWALVWKGLALWVAARRGHTIWFIVFLVVNLLGIPEIIYLLSTKGFDELKTKK